MRNLLKYEIRSRWIGTLGWGMGLGLFAGIYISFYPQFYQQLGDLADIPIYAALGVDITSFAGYISSTIVQYDVLIFLVFAVLASTGILAGEEESGTLEMVLAMPLKRWQIVSMKAAALAIITFFILLIAAIFSAVSLELVKGASDIEVNVSVGQLLLVTLNGWPIMMALTMIGMFLGAFMPSRRAATLTLTTFIFVSYFGQILANMIESLDTVRNFSIFHYFDTDVTVFTEGIQTGDVLVLLAIAGLFFALTLVSFQSRNITVGEWTGRRAKATG